MHDELKLQNPNVRRRKQKSTSGPKHIFQEIGPKEGFFYESVIGLLANDSLVLIALCLEKKPKQQRFKKKMQKMAPRGFGYFGGWFFVSVVEGPTPTWGGGAGFLLLTDVRG